MSRFWAKYLDFWVNSWFSVIYWMVFLIGYIVYIYPICIYSKYTSICQTSNGFISPHIPFAVIALWRFWDCASTCLECQAILWRVGSGVMERGALHSSASALGEIVVFFLPEQSKGIPISICTDWSFIYQLRISFCHRNSSPVVSERILFWSIIYFKQHFGNLSYPSSVSPFNSIIMTVWTIDFQNSFIHTSPSLYLINDQRGKRLLKPLHWMPQVVSGSHTSWN